MTTPLPSAMRRSLSSARSTRFRAASSVDADRVGDFAVGHLPVKPQQDRLAVRLRQPLDQLIQHRRELAPLRIVRRRELLLSNHRRLRFVLPPAALLPRGDLGCVPRGAMQPRDE